jgi:hypothetical protein
MSQGIYDDINPNTTSGNELATLLNEFKDAVASGFSGTTRPVNLQANGYWIDTTLTPNFHEMKFYDGTQDILLFTLNLSTGVASVGSSDELLSILKESNDALPPILKFVKKRTGLGQTLTNDEIGRINFSGTDSGGNETPQAYIKSVTTDDTNPTALGSYLSFELADDNTGSITETMRLTNSSVGINETNPDVTLHVKGDGIKNERASADTVSAKIQLEKKRLANNGQVLSGDKIGEIEHQSTDQNGTVFEAASIESEATENHTDTARGTRINFATIDNGDTTSSVKMRIGDNVTVIGELAADSLNIGTLSSDDITATDATDTTDSPTLFLEKQRATGNGQVLTNDGIGKVEFQSTDINGDTFEAASIEAFATENQTASARGNKIQIKTIAQGGTGFATRLEIDETVTVPGDLTVQGDLTVDGTTTTVNTATLDVTDANITVNNTGDQATANANVSGLTVEMSDATDARIGYDSSLTSKFKLGEVGSEVEIADVSSAQSISNKAIIDPSRLDVKKDTEANLTTYASTADDGQLCFATDTQQMYQVIDNALAQVGGGGGIGGIDIIDVETFEETAAADLSSGNSAFYDAGGSLAGSLADNEVTPISGDRSIQYTQAIGSEDDWVEMKLFTIQEREQGKLAKFSVYGKYDGIDGDIVLRLKDSSGNIISGSSPIIKNTGKVDKYEVLAFIPDNATTVSFGFQVVNENNGQIFEFDDVEGTLNVLTQEALQEENNFSAIITNNGTAAIQSQGGTNNSQQNAIASVTRSGLGRVDIVFTSNFFSVIPKIDVSIERTIDQNFGYGIESLTTSGCTIVTSRATSFVDMDFHIGIQRQGSDYNGLNSNVITPARSNMLDYTEYTPTIQGCASVSNVNIFYKQIGDAYHILGSFTPTTLQAVEAQVSLPNGKAVKSGLNLTVCGTGSTAASTADVRTMITGGDTFLNFANTSNAPQNGTPVFGLSGFTFSFEAMVPIEGLSSEAQFLAALPKLDVATTTEKILSADVTSDGDIAGLQFDNLTVGNTYYLSGTIESNDTTAGRKHIVEAWSGATKTGELYGRIHQNEASNTQTISGAVSLIIPAKSTSLYINVTDNDLIRGNGTKEETFLQLTDITSEFIKKAPKNRYGEKILSADVNSNQDVSDLQFNNLEIGKQYEITGLVRIQSTSGAGQLLAYSGASQAGTFYGSVAINSNSDTPTSDIGTNPSLKFTAQSTTLYLNYNTNSNEILRGNGTKEETFLQLEERRDLELTTNFD